MFSCMIRVLLFSRQLPRRRQCRNHQARPHHRLAMIVEVGGIREAVAPYVGAVWILLIRPPVVAFGEVVMRPTLAPFAVRGGHRDRLLGKISICSAENSRPVRCRDKVIRRGGTAGPGS